MRVFGLVAGHRKRVEGEMDLVSKVGKAGGGGKTLGRESEIKLGASEVYLMRSPSERRLGLLPIMPDSHCYSSVCIYLKLSGNVCA